MWSCAEEKALPSPRHVWIYTRKSWRQDRGSAEGWHLLTQSSWRWPSPHLSLIATVLPTLEPMLSRGNIGISSSGHLWANPSQEGCVSFPMQGGITGNFHVIFAQNRCSSIHGLILCFSSNHQCGIVRGVMSLGDGGKHTHQSGEDRQASPSLTYGSRG